MVDLELGSHGAADTNETAFGVLEINPVGQVAQERVKEVAFLGQFFFGPFALDGVAHGPDEQGRVHDDL